MFFDVFADLCAKNNESPNKVAKKLNIASGTVSEWKKGREPQHLTIKKIAEYFNVSVDYLLGRDMPAEKPFSDNIQPVEVIRYPVIGRITAGYTGLAVEEPTGDFIEVPSDIMRGYTEKDFFVLEIQGDSMSPKLLNGDRVLVKRCDSVDSGTIVVFLYNGIESTVKRVRYVAGEDWLELVPDNPDYPVKRVEGPDLERCRVLGKIVYLFRKM